MKLNHALGDIVTLRPGDVFLWPGTSARWEVVSVGSAGAYVRPQDRQRREITTGDGDRIAFDAPGRSLTISARALVEFVERGPLPKRTRVEV